MCVTKATLAIDMTNSTTSNASHKAFALVQRTHLIYNKRNYELEIVKSEKTTAKLLRAGK